MMVPDRGCAPVDGREAGADPLQRRLDLLALQGWAGWLREADQLAKGPTHAELREFSGANWPE